MFFFAIIFLFSQDLLGKLEEKENELNSENKNALKRDKTIQGLTQVLRDKEKEVNFYTFLFYSWIIIVNVSVRRRNPSVL